MTCNSIPGVYPKERKASPDKEKCTILLELTNLLDLFIMAKTGNNPNVSKCTGTS